MPRASPALSSFNAGELGVTLDARTDISKYGSGAHRLENFIALVQGPAQRRGGSRFVAEAKHSGRRVWKRRFEFSATQAFILEFGHQYIRFYTLHGRVLVGDVPAWSDATSYVPGDLVAHGGVNYYCIAANTNQQPPNATYWHALEGDIYEVPTPYDGDDLTNSEGCFALQVEQSADVLYIAGAGKYPPMTLTRYGATRWVLAEYVPENGPFMDQNRDKSVKVQASAQTGSITITATAGIFSATDVGRLIRIEQESPNIEPWEPDSQNDVNAGELRRYDGRTYKALNTAKTGTSPPIHIEGVAPDGQADGGGRGVLWEYQDAGYGIARITGFTSATIVTAEVLVQLPALVVSGPTYRWSLGAWSRTSGYPSAVAFAYDRLWWAHGINLWGSVPGLYTDHSPDVAGQVTFDSAISLKLTAQDVNEILWMVEAERLIIGTPGGEFALGPITTVDPLGPENVQIKRQSKKRCRSVRPQIVGTSVVYVQRAGRRLLVMDYAFEIDRYRSTNMNALNPQITKSGIVDMAYQAEPDSILWCVLADGSLIAFTLDQEQDVVAWHRHPIGGNGFVESVECIPDPTGDRDEVWIVVRRTINGQTKRYIEYIERPWEQGDDPAAVFYVDSGLTYSGAPARTISGLDHLEGEIVQVVTDGAAHPDRRVSGGSITLQSEASTVQVGLPCPARLVTMRLEAGSEDGTAQGKVKRVRGATVRLVDTLGGKIGMEGRKLYDIPFRRPSMAMDQPPEIFTGDKEVTFDGDYEPDCRIELVQEQPFPMTIAGIFPRLVTHDARG
jgi:hypothetical protein